MKKFFKTPDECFELLTRVLCDVRPPRKADLMYLYGQTAFNQNSVFEKAADSLKSSTTQRIGISNYEPSYGYEGGDVWFKELVQRGIAQEAIVPIPQIEERFQHCTDSEADGLVAFALEHGWDTIIITASPLHQVRAFVSTVSAMRYAQADLKLYSGVGHPVDWLQHIVHSQGTDLGIRKDLLVKGELAKLDKYHEKGDLLSARQIIDYLDQRG